MGNAWKTLIKLNNGLISVSIREMKKLCRTRDILAVFCAFRIFFDDILWWVRNCHAKVV